MDKSALHLEHIAKLLTPAERKRERVVTASEARDRAAIRDEKTIQQQIATDLRRRGIEFINPPMHKRSMLPSGWPDFTLAINGAAVAWECKVWGEKPDAHQLERHAAMSRNGWRVRTIYSLADAQAHLRELDAATEP